jgi:hypothetical protein
MWVRRGESGLLIPTPGIEVARTIPGTLGQSYSDKVLNTENANLIAYWRLSEASGTVADNYQGTAARDAAYSNCTLGETGIGDGLTSAKFDGSLSYVNTYTTSLRDALNGAEGSMAIWAKINSATEWTDGLNHWFVRFYGGSNDYIAFGKPTTSSKVNWYYKAGGVSVIPGKTSLSSTDWMHFAMSWSKSADQVRAYYNGVEISGSPATGLGTWAGTLANGNTQIGAAYIVGWVWYGWLAHAALWTSVLTPAQVATLATV